MGWGVGVDVEGRCWHHTTEIEKNAQKLEHTRQTELLQTPLAPLATKHVTIRLTFMNTYGCKLW